MGVPKQVAQDIKDVEEMERQMAAQSEPTTVEPEAVTPETQEVEAQPTVVPDQPTAVQEVEDWQQKYRTLKGMYDKDVPVLHQQVKQLNAQIQDMSQKLERKAAEPAPEPQKLVTATDVETFGADLIDLQRRIAQEVSSKFETQLESLTAQNADLKQKLEQTGTRVGEMTFEQRLNRAVPDFEAINADPKWVGWLDEVDPLLRAPRRVVAQEAFDKGDVDAISHYVNLFRQGQSPAPSSKRQSELESQVTPTRISAGTGTVPQGKTYTVASWGTAYNKVAQLNAQGKYDEATKLEAELDAAANEGRVAA